MAKQKSIYELASQTKPAQATKIIGGANQDTIASLLKQTDKSAATKVTTPTATTKTATTAAPAAPTYAGTYEDQLADIYAKIQNREPFQYDVNADPLYQQYKDNYIQGGKLAMKDTMGQAAALTGGYGSTYGQQVGQQAYDAYLQNLSAAIPELYNMAYGMYQDKGDDLMQQYSMLGDMRNTEYSQWRDAMSDYNYDREFQLKQEDIAYERQQQAYNKLVSLITSTGYKPTKKEMEQAGLTQRQLNKLLKQWQKANKKTTTKSTGGGGGGGGGKSSTSTKKSGNYSDREIQEAIEAGATFQEIWDTLPSQQKTPEMKTRISDGITRHNIG